jgi:peptidoglycan/LPS O-acetylase OafA/YrhL
MLVINAKKRTVLYVCFALVISAPIFRSIFVTYFAESGESMAYTFTVARYDALAVGAVIALVVRNSAWSIHLKDKSTLAIICIVSIMVLLLAKDHNFAPAQGSLGALNQTLVAILFGIVIYKCVEINAIAKSVYHRLLTSKFLTLAGKYSYAIYIFHVPVKYEWFASFSLNPMAYDNTLGTLAMIYNFCSVFLISTGLAMVSWYLIERRCLEYKRLFV